MPKPTPIGRDAAATNYASLVSAFDSLGIFGRPETQSTGDGIEKMFHCPLCIAEGKGTGHRKHLRVAKRTDGGALPFVGCRVHDSAEDWAKIRTALVDAGLPDGLLAPAKGLRGEVPGSGSLKGGQARFIERGDGLGEADPIDPALVERWAANLWGLKGAPYLEYLRERGLEDTTIKGAQLGIGGFVWTPGKKKNTRITIPIFNADGLCVNVRLYTAQGGAKMLPYPHPTRRTEDGSKFLTYATPTRLYGVDVLAADSGVDLRDGGDPVRYVFVCAGEWDRLLLAQEGLLAVTGTGAEKTLPRAEDCAYLADRDVIVVYDCDAAGRSGAAKFARAALAIGAVSVRIVDLAPEQSDGYDIGDLWADVDKPVDELIWLVENSQTLEPGDFDNDPDDSFAPVWEFSDLGIAEQVSYAKSGSLRYVPESTSWISWIPENGVWEKYNKSDLIAPAEAITNYVREVRRSLADAEEDSAESQWSRFVHQYLNTSKNGSAIRALSHLWDMRVRIANIDASPRLLNLANGTLNLEDGSLRTPRPQDFLTKRANGGLLPDGGATAGEQEWQRALDRSVPDPETQQALQWISGVSLLDGNPLQVMVFLMGGTGTGKSVFSELFMHALGDYAGSFNLSMFRDNQDEKPRADLVRALTQRVIFASEASEQWRLHVDQIKRLTGEDSITARLPHSGEYIERAPAFTPWFRTNQAPHIETPDLALYRRLVVFPFEHPYSAQGKGTGNSLGGYVARSKALLADAIITWAVDGLFAWQDAGGGEIMKSREMLLAEATFREALNDTQVFLAEETEPDSAGRVVFKELYDRYLGWAVDSGVYGRDTLSKKAFGDRLSGLGYGRKESNSVTYRTGLVLRRKTLQAR